MAAWREFKETRATQGAAGEEMLAMSRPPGGFVAVELGFGFGEGPSILATLQDFGRAEEHGRVLLGDRRMVTPKHLDGWRTESTSDIPSPKQRESASARQRRLDGMLRHSMRKQHPIGSGGRTALEAAVERDNAKAA